MIPAVIAGCSAGLLGLVVGRWLAQRSEAAPQLSEQPTFDDYPLPTVECDAEWRILWCNKAFTEVFGYPADVVRGLALVQLTDDRERTRVRRRLGAAGGVPSALRTTLRRPDGSSVSAVLHARELPNGQALVALHAQADTGTVRMAQLSASVREPLMTILGSAESLVEDSPSGSLDVVLTIQDSARQLARALDTATGVSQPADNNTRSASRVRASRADREDGPWRLLVVEDHEVNAKVLRRSLSRLGIPSVWSRNGEECLSMLEREAFDAVLMDCQMPVMDGYEATRRIREDARWADVPVIAVTAHAMDEDRQRCLRVGMDDHLTKPVGIPELRRILTLWLGDLGLGGELVLDESALETLAELLGSETRSTVELFLSDGTESLEVMAHNLEAKEWEELGRRAHSMRSTSAYVGAAELSGNCERLVRCARSTDAAGAAAELKRLKAGFLVVSQALRARLESSSVLAPPSGT